MNIIIHINGGQGKCIAATAVCRAIKTQYPKDDLIIRSAYSEVFLCNPDMKAYNFNDMRYFLKELLIGLMKLNQ